MPTFNVQVVDNRVLMVVHISLPDSTNPLHICNALVDTGASATAVSPIVVQALGAVSSGVRTVGTASQPNVEAEQFVLDIHIPVDTHRAGPDGQPVVTRFSEMQRVTAAQLPIGDGTYDVLLGMDILAAHHISMHSGQFVMSI